MSERPLPDVSARMRPFWEAARERRLSLQRCEDCGRHLFPAVDLCPVCLGAHLTWVDASGRATLFSYVVVHQTHDRYFATRTPYAVVDVQLEEGPHMTSSVIGVAPGRLRIGMPLSVVFEKVTDEISLPAFQPAGG